ncbi:MAG: hypothetical protein ABSG93_03760 [Solirubrobacteraceae bacterium]|jgi:hypothetical protein
MLSEKKQTEVGEVLRGESRGVLLSGVALNWLGAAKLAREVWLAKRQPEPPADYDQLKAFTAGTAATFGSFYLYLYVAKKPVVPLLMFGAALKMWAFVLSVILFVQGRLDRGNFLSFGVSNGVVGGLFWVHIAAEARAGRHR